MKKEIPDDEKNMDFKHMTIGDVEVLVGRKARDVWQEGKWLVCLFPCKTNSRSWVGADITVRIKKW